jgi:hypothetical protein
MKHSFDEVNFHHSLWLLFYEEAAHAEGWSIWNTYGSDNGVLQVQGLDAKLGDPDWISDAQALKLVREGTEPHHVAARALLAKFNPKELEHE